MNKRQAETLFRQEVFPGILKAEAKNTGHRDKPLRAEAWGVFTDALCKSGHISQRQYETWETPRWLLKKT